jgi:hypothetical protein
MRIFITDQAHQRSEVCATLVADDHWVMTHTAFDHIFDEYFTSDVFDLARDILAPAC